MIFSLSQIFWKYFTVAPEYVYSYINSCFRGSKNLNKPTLLLEYVHPSYIEFFFKYVISHLLVPSIWAISILLLISLELDQSAHIINPSP